MPFLARFRCLIVAVLILAMSAAGTVEAAGNSQQAELLIYCGITMVRPMSEVARLFEANENVRVTMAQGGSEDLYQSAKKSRLGDLYFPGEPAYRAQHLAEGLLGDYVTVGYNQLALMVRKGNPKKVRGNLRELLRDDLLVIIGNAQSGSIGQATRRALERQGIYQKVLEKSVFLAPDSRNLNLAMKQGEADLIVNWRATGFFADNSTIIDVIDLPPREAKPEALLLNLLTFSKQKPLALRFMKYVTSPVGQAIFRKYGFHDNTYLSRK